MTSGPSPAAWVPDDDERRPWDIAAALADAWLTDEARRLGQPPVVIASAGDQLRRLPAPIARHARQGQTLTPRSGGRPTMAGPVLAYAPDYAAFSLAVQWASGTALVVIETISSPLGGWAVEAGAVNLVTGVQAADMRSAELREDLDRIAFYGNNAWNDRFSKERTASILEALRQRGPLDHDLIVGSMLARGYGADAVANLGRLIDDPFRRRA